MAGVLPEGAIDFTQEPGVERLFPPDGFAPLGRIGFRIAILEGGRYPRALRGQPPKAGKYARPCDKAVGCIPTGGLLMADHEQLRKIVEDLIDVMHLQAKEMEKLVDHIEQATGHLGYQTQFSVIASELSELHIRIRKHGLPPGSAAD
jgi:hypothetical protein